MSFLSSTIGRKQVVGICGLGLCLFILTHMLGNLLIFVGEGAYNQYAHALTSNPLIYIAEAGLLSILLGHILFAVIVTLRNRAARPQKYAVKAKGAKATSFVARTMIHQGVIVLVFIVHHLITFKYGPSGKDYEVEYDGVVMRNLYKLLEEIFANPFYVGWYVFAVFVLGYHLSHGFSSAVKTLGYYHPKHNCLINKLGWAFSAVVTLGFISQPLYIFMVNY